MRKQLIDNETVILIKGIVEEQLRAMGVDPEVKLWVNSKEAREILGDISVTQLYLLRTQPEHKLVFSQRNRKNVLYLRSSLISYIERHIR
jgi:uncharacterized protein YbcI